MEIKILREFEGAPFGWWVKGHHNSKDFINACESQHHEPSWRDWIAKESDVRKTYWRSVPVHDSSDRILSECKKGRGAFPVTLVEWVKPSKPSEISK